MNICSDQSTGQVLISVMYAIILVVVVVAVVVDDDDDAVAVD